VQLKIIIIKEADLDIKLDLLKLPSRFEMLQREVDEQGLGIETIVRKVDTAHEEVENLLKQIQIGSIGKFKFFLGKTGAGKTTFLKSFPEFFTDIVSIPIANSEPLETIISIIKTTKSDKQRIFVLEDRDNPNEDIEDLKIFFEDLRAFFRTEVGKILLIWPITNEESCETISKIVWNVGGDSLTSHDGAIYKFKGLSSELYYEVANNTTQSLNETSLGEYGIEISDAQDMIESSESIGHFFSKLQIKSAEINDNAETFLKEKEIPRVWILLPGDEATEIERTVESLTKGVNYQIDIEKLIALIDDESKTNTYLTDWRSRRGKARFLLKLLDIRLFPIFPNQSVPCVRAFGEDQIKVDLTKKTETVANAIEATKKSPIYKVLFNEHGSGFRAATKSSDSQIAEYKSFQKFAGDKDKLLNQTLGKSLIETFRAEGIDTITVAIEKTEIKGLNLQPDVMLRIKDEDVICFEPTWRSTSSGSGTNTLTSGHIKQYVLKKAMEYVKDLGY